MYEFACKHERSQAECVTCWLDSACLHCRQQQRSLPYNHAMHNNKTTVQLVIAQQLRTMSKMLTWQATSICAVAKLFWHKFCTKKAACMRIGRAQAGVAKRATTGTAPTKHMASITAESCATRAFASSKAARATCNQMDVKLLSQNSITNTTNLVHHWLHVRWVEAAGSS